MNSFAFILAGDGYQLRLITLGTGREELSCTSEVLDDEELHLQVENEIFFALLYWLGFKKSKGPGISLVGF